MKKRMIDGSALVYCEGAFNTPSGKTAHGLVRITERYKVLGVIDSTYAGQDAGEVLDGKSSGILIFDSLGSAINAVGKPEYFVIGLAPDGGRLPKDAWETIFEVARANIHIDSGLHDFLSNNKELMQIANDQKIRIRDIRKTPGRNELHFFTGKINEVDCLKLAILGTDSAIGKRTTAWIIVQGLRKSGLKAEMVGTGQTAWMQGAKYSFVMDSLINDFVSGEIEHAVYEAWKNERPDVIIIEGQGSLMNPAYPGGFEILAAGRPDYVILQHAPRRKEYDGFPGYALHPLKKQIEAIEMISGIKVAAITLNHEHMKPQEIERECDLITAEIGLSCVDVLHNGPDRLIDIIKNFL
jgi:uncharacterized NAD-dependent epimerase/dehydratase family protein